MRKPGKRFRDSQPCDVVDVDRVSPIANLTRLNNVPGRPAVFLYSLEVLARVLQRPKSTVRWWLETGTLRQPLFHIRHPKTRWWFSADEIECLLICACRATLGNYAHASLKLFLASANQEIAVIGNRMASGEMTPQRHLDAAKITEIQAIYGMERLGKRSKQATKEAQSKRFMKEESIHGIVKKYQDAAGQPKPKEYDPAAVIGGRTVSRAEKWCDEARRRLGR